MDYKVGDKIIIANPDEDVPSKKKFKNHIGRIDYVSESDFLIHDITDESQNLKFKYRSKDVDVLDWFFYNRELRLANLNRRIIEEK